ncbi:MAG: hypothetical protein ABH842_02850 [Candidatus Micrarchaeota archaeon]
MAERQREEASPPTVLDLTKPIPLSKETQIRLLKQSFEKQTTPMDIRLYDIRELARLGETNYLTGVKMRYGTALTAARKRLDTLNSERLGISLNLGSRAYGELRKGISNEEWEKLPKRKQDELAMEAEIRLVGPVMARYDADIKRQEQAIERMERIVAEIGKVVPAIKIDF